MPSAFEATNTLGLLDVNVARSEKPSNNTACLGTKVMVFPDSERLAWRGLQVPGFAPMSDGDADADGDAAGLGDESAAMATGAPIKTTEPTVARAARMGFMGGPFTCGDGCVVDAWQVLVVPTRRNVK